jgi:hypothetical protein
MKIPKIAILQREVILEELYPLCDDDPEAFENVIGEIDELISILVEEVEMQTRIEKNKELSEQK